MSNRLSGMRADGGYSYRSLEAVAHSVRTHLEIGATERFDAQDFFEFKLDTIRVSDGEEEFRLVHGVAQLDTEALTYWNPDERRMELLLSERSYDWLCSGHPRPRYTIAHELGHALLHTRQLMRLATVNPTSKAAMHRGYSEHAPYMDTEWQANGFASALLIPARGIAALARQFGTVPSAGIIASAYEVSLEAAGYRLETYRSGKTGI